MKIRYGESLVAFFDIIFGILLIWISTLSYFLGFSINLITLLYYILSILIIVLICIGIYAGYILLCKTFIIFTDEAIIKIKKDKVLMSVEYSQIMNAKYYPIMDWFVGGSKGGNLIIEAESPSKADTLTIYIPIFKSKLKDIKRIPIRIVERRLEDIFRSSLT